MFCLIVSRPLCEREIALWTSPEERAQACGFAPARRSEWLSWRALVRRQLCGTTGCDPRRIAIGYDAVGAPRVEIQESPTEKSFCVSVSHCGGSIAVALADAPCAVDIETLDRDFGRVAPRYMTCDERALSDDARWPAIVWCAKETLYKFAGRRELDLLHDLRIEAVDFAAATLVGRIGGGEPLTLRFLVLAGRVIVYRT